MSPNDQEHGLDKLSAGAPVQMDAGGSVGQVWTRVLHYHYNCDRSFQNCKDEEQFYLANGYGLWQ